MTPKYQNFTQFAGEHGLPCDYDTMFEAQLLGSRGLAGRISKRQIKLGDARFRQMIMDNSKAKDLFIEAVLSGEIIDISGEYVREDLLNQQVEAHRKQQETEKRLIQDKIAFIESLGSMSHTNNGKLRKGYQIQVDELNKQLKEMQE